MRVGNTGSTLSGWRVHRDPRRLSRLEDGTLLADSMPTPECLARRVAAKFRYGGSKLDSVFRDECAAFGNKEKTSAASWLESPQCAASAAAAAAAAARDASASYAPAAAGWAGAGGSRKRVAPLLTYHYLPASSTPPRHHRDGIRPARILESA